MGIFNTAVNKNVQDMHHNYANCNIILSRKELFNKDNT